MPSAPTKNKLPQTTLTKLQYCQKLLWSAQKLESYAMRCNRSLAINLRGHTTVDDLISEAIHPTDRKEYFGLSDRSSSIFLPLIELGMFSSFDYRHCPKFWGVQTRSSVPVFAVVKKLRQMELKLRNTPDAELFVLDLFEADAFLKLMPSVRG